jgi:hypothetical protein
MTHPGGTCRRCGVAFPPDGGQFGWHVCDSEEGSSSAAEGPKSYALSISEVFMLALTRAKQAAITSPATIALCILPMLVIGACTAAHADDFCAGFIGAGRASCESNMAACGDVEPCRALARKWMLEELETRRSCTVEAGSGPFRSWLYDVCLARRAGPATYQQRETNVRTDGPSNPELDAMRRQLGAR